MFPATSTAVGSVGERFFAGIFISPPLRFVLTRVRMPQNVVRSNIPQGFA